MSFVHYVIPLVALEHQLLDHVESILDSFDIPKPPPQSGDQWDVFQHWEWTTNITKYLHQQLDWETVEAEHGGDRDIAYADILHALSRHQRPASDLFRVTALEKANPSFLAELGKRPAQEVKCVPASQDAHYWSLLQAVYSHGKLKLQHDFVLEPVNTFAIWEAVQALLIESTLIENASESYINVFSHPDFQSLYAIRPSLDSQKDNPATHAAKNLEAHPEQFCKETKVETWGKPQEWRIFHRLNHGQIRRWPDGKAMHDANGDLITDYLEHLLRELGSQRTLEDPRNYLHMLPWSQLVPIPWQRVENDVGFDDPFDDIRGNVKIFGCMLWEPPSAAFKWLHHLRTEDEVLQYCMAQDWTLPAYSYHDKVLFTLRPIEESLLFKQLDQYWDLWNDCALTISPIDQHIFVLETIPGLQFRSRVEHQDKHAALKYFRNIVEAHHAGTLHERAVEDLLGPDNALPYFDKSLPIIPQTQLSKVSSSPIGHGANGAVYAAQWQRSGGALATTNSEASQISVVLKEILPVGRGGSTVQRLLKELNLTYTALAGSGTGCVRFMGVTALYTSRLNDSPSRIHRNEDRRLLLVFERATEGSLLEYLDKALPGLSFTYTWDKVIGIISNVANGLYSLHRHNVVHRDLHPNNVLIARTYHVNDSEDHAIVTDIGEGKILDARGIENSAGASYGCSEFRAPEVHGAQGWSLAADVFSFGVICCKVLELRANVSTGPVPTALRQFISGSDGEELVPEEIKSILEGCLKPEAIERPTIRSVITDLDNLSRKFWYEEDGYTHQSALKEEPETLLKQIQWTSFSWRRALAIVKGALPARHVGDHITRDSILGDD